MAAEQYMQAELAVLAQRVEAMREDFGEMHQVLRELTGAINKLALIEERQAHSTQAQERAFLVIAKIEERVSALERRAPESDRVRAWVDRGVLAVFGVVFLSAAKAFGFL